MRSPRSGTVLRNIPRTRAPRSASGAVTALAVLQQADEHSHRTETRQDDQGRVECWDPPDLVTLYDVDPHGQDQATESPTCAGWRLASAIRRLRCLDGAGVPGDRWLDRPFTASAPTRHDGYGNDEKPFALIGCAKGASHRYVLGNFCPAALGCSRFDLPFLPAPLGDCVVVSSPPTGIWLTKADRRPGRRHRHTPGPTVPG